MNVVFRADASLQIGTGHVMRCLMLANALREGGANCRFVCRAHAGHLAELIRGARHELCLLPSISRLDNTGGDYASWLGCSQEEDAEQTRGVLQGECDWLVVDHYALDASWESRLRPYARSIMVIDDLANRHHDCDLLLDQNLGRETRDYDGLVPVAASCLIGPRYALLRPEFAKWREYSLKRREQASLKQILVTLGGVDKDNVTGAVLEALKQAILPEDCHIVVVMGAHAPWLEKVRVQAAALPVVCTVKVNVSNMAELMANSDLAIGASGGTAWERCCLGLPALSLVLAENQRSIAMALDQEGAALICGGLGRLAADFQNLSAHEHLRRMSVLASHLVDGQGGQRVVATMEMGHG